MIFCTPPRDIGLKILVVVMLVCAVGTAMGQPKKLWKRDQLHHSSPLYYDKELELVYLFASGHFYAVDAVGDTIQWKSDSIADMGERFHLLSDSTALSVTADNRVITSNFRTGEVQSDTLWDVPILGVDPLSNVFLDIRWPVRDTMMIRVHDVTDLSLIQTIKARLPLGTLIESGRYDRDRNTLILHAGSVRSGDLLLTVDSNGQIDTVWAGARNWELLESEQLSTSKLALLLRDRNQPNRHVIQTFDVESGTLSNEVTVQRPLPTNPDNSLVTRGDGRILYLGSHTVPDKDALFVLRSSPLEIELTLDIPPTIGFQTNSPWDQLLIFGTRSDGVYLFDDADPSISMILNGQPEILDIEEFYDGSIVACFTNKGVGSIDVATGDIVPSSLKVDTPQLTQFIATSARSPVVAYRSNLDIYLWNNQPLEQLCRLQPETSPSYRHGSVSPDWVSSDGSTCIITTAYNSTNSTSGVLFGIDLFISSSPCNDESYQPVYDINMAPVRRFLYEQPREISVHPDGIALAVPVLDSGRQDTAVMLLPDVTDHESMREKVIFFSESSRAEFITGTNKVVLDGPTGFRIIDLDLTTPEEAVDLGERYLPLGTLNTEPVVIAYSDSTLSAFKSPSWERVWTIPLAYTPERILVSNSDKWFIVEQIGKQIELYSLSSEVSVTESSSPRGKWTVWPNPATSMIHIDGARPNCQYTIINLLGQVVKEGRVPELGQVSLEDVSSGTYLLSIDGKAQVLSVR
jgi:hypothetical protein